MQKPNDIWFGSSYRDICVFEHQFLTGFFLPSGPAGDETAPIEIMSVLIDDREILKRFVKN